MPCLQRGGRSLKQRPRTATSLNMQHGKVTQDVLKRNPKLIKSAACRFVDSLARQHGCAKSKLRQ
jgi:hypothetical protein